MAEQPQMATREDIDHLERNLKVVIGNQQLILSELSKIKDILLFNEEGDDSKDDE